MFTHASVHRDKKMQRLVDLVERRQLHRHSDVGCPRQWLNEWLTTPRDELRGREPSHLLEHDDAELMLMGILVKEQTVLAWRQPVSNDQSMR